MWSAEGGFHHFLNTKHQLVVTVLDFAIMQSPSKDLQREA